MSLIRPWLALAVAAAATGSAARTEGIEPTPLTLMPRSVASFGAATCDGWLYVYGGHHGRAHDHCLESISDAFYRISLVDRTSIELLPAGPRVQGASLVAYEGGLVRVGGMTARNARGEEEDLFSLPDVARFDPVTRLWTDLPPLPRGRSSHDAGIIDGVLHVAGGWALDGGSDGKWETEIVALDLARPEAGWSVVAHLTAPRRAVDVTVHDGRLFVIGGLTEDGEMSAEVAVLDPRDGSWSVVPDFPGRGFAISATVVEGVLWASGMDGEIFKLAPDGASWMWHGRLAAPRIFHRMEPVSAGKIAVVGGAMRGGHLGFMEWIDTRRSPEEPLLAEIRLPFPGAAKNRQGSWVDGNDLILFGGNRSGGQHDFEPEDFVREGLRLNLATLRFRPVSDFPAPRQSIAMVRDDVLGDRAWAVGGFGHDGEVARSHADIHAYDRETDRWETAIARLPEPRTQFETVARDGGLWILGGLDHDPGREQAFIHPLDVLRFDPATRAVESAGFALTRPRRAFGAATIGDRTYLIGGMGPAFEVVPACESFDWTQREWSEIPAPARPRISPEVVAIDDRVIVIGGSSPAPGGGDFEPNQSVEAYDPATNRWSTLIEELPFPVRHVQAHLWSGRIVLFTIEGGERSSLRLFFLDPGASKEPGVTEEPASRPSGA